jgi:hypothetical protein
MGGLKILGAAVVLLSLAGTAMAQQLISQRGRHAESYYCGTRDPGNPYSARYDYMTWSFWRGSGAWDSRGDDACMRNPHVHHQEVGF